MPLYAQLTRAIQFAITTGRLRIGEQLPTVRQLAVELRVNANTVAKVYAELEREGILETRRGVGTFVCARHFEAKSRQDQNEILRELVDRFVEEAASDGLLCRRFAGSTAKQAQKEIRKMSDITSLMQTRSSYLHPRRIRVNVVSAAAFLLPLLVGRPYNGRLRGPQLE